MSREIEDRLRAALGWRADRVEARAVDVSDLEVRAAAARRAGRRRRVLLSAAAVVAVIAASVASYAVAGDDDETRVATGVEATTTTADTTTTTDTTITTAPTDDRVPGWPGAVARVFDDPDAAALAFVTEVLGFADPALEHTTTEGPDAVAVYHPRPTASVSTNVFVHHTGPVRGWVVTGVQSDQGSIDEATVQNGSVHLRGSATAFEATVAVLVLDAEGNVLARDVTMAGANGEQGPYDATIAVDPAAGTPSWVMIAEGDASGEGELIWATTAPVGDR